MLEENTLFAHRYRLVKRLGQGAFSEVWKAEDTKAGSMVVALKIYAPDKGMDEDGVKMFSSEFTLVFNVSHKNLLTPSYYDDYNGSPYLVLPFCEQGSAQRRIGLMDEREMAKFLFDVSGALAFLHAQHPPIIHQDIKPDNVLIDASGTYRVTDFGISTNLRSTLRKSVGASRANDSAGTMAYMGPERFNKNRETVKASDVWSLGATAYELMCSDVPFGEFGGLSQKNGADMPEVAGDYTQSLKQLVLNCLAKDTWDRPTAAQVNEICSQYLRDGYWNLEKLGMAAAPKKEVADKPSRATQRKVDRGDDPEPVKPPQPDNVLPKLGLAKIGAAAAIVLAVLLTVFLFPNKEERMWKKTEKSDSYESYTAYLQAYPGGKHVNDAKYHLSEYYKTQLEYLEGEVPIAIRELENEWNRYDESVGSLNILWEETETILHHDEDYYRVGRCNNIRSIMEEAVEKKIKAEENNFKLDPSDDTKRNISVLKSFKGYEAEAAAEKRKLEFTVNGVAFKMVYVEGGTFQMGATSEQGSDCDDDEKPAHSVTVSDFYMGETEVTQALWKAVMGSNPSNFKGDNLPVETVSWGDCQEFIQKLNQLTGRIFRLPTEAQWEYAARGGNKSNGYKYAGGSSVGNVAWYSDNSSSETHPVKSKQPNELGLYDMSGNVWECCSDWYGSYGSAAQTNPQGPSSSSSRVLRGGSWFGNARYCRVSYRSYGSPDDRFNSYGFRLSLVP